MTNSVKAAVLGGLLVAGLATASLALPAAKPDNAVREDQAVAAELGANTSAVSYWVSRPDGWHVVTTVDAVIGQGGDTDRHVVTRFSSVLLSGQSQLISVPSAIGQQQQVLRIRRLGDRIEAALIPSPSV